MINRQIQQHVQSAITEKRYQAVTGRLGVVISYDKYDNTATVAVTSEHTDEIDDILTKVMCPVVLGVQTVAPSPGLQCWVVFKDNNISQPLISHFYNHRYSQYDYPKQTPATNNIPSYLLGL
jgi:hypothetical protein